MAKKRGYNWSRSEAIRTLVTAGIKTSSYDDHRSEIDEMVENLLKEIKSDYSSISELRMLIPAVNTSLKLLKDVDDSYAAEIEDLQHLKKGVKKTISTLNQILVDGYRVVDKKIAKNLDNPDFIPVALKTQTPAKKD